jgi:GntR family carbon starvation induced transcriptional regulator
MTFFGRLAASAYQGTEHRTLTGEILDRLRRDIIAGAFVAGDKIKAEELKRRYNVGTSPIREALFQLVSDGLVHSDGQKGFRVADMKTDDLMDIADWRARLECEALRRSIAKGDVNWEANALAAFHRLKKVEQETKHSSKQAADLWEDYHRAYHFSLYSACGSPWLLRFCDLLIQHGERYRRAYIQYPSVPKTITQEHEDILLASVARDTNKAVALLEKHITHAVELALQNASKKGRSPAPSSEKKTRTRTHKSIRTKKKAKE